MHQAAGPLRFFNSGVEVAVDGSPVLHQPRPTTNEVANKCLLLSGVMEASTEVGFPSFGGGRFGSPRHPPRSPARQNLYCDQGSAEYISSMEQCGRELEGVLDDDLGGALDDNLGQQMEDSSKEKVRYTSYEGSVFYRWYRIEI